MQFGIIPLISSQCWVWYF